MRHFFFKSKYFFRYFFFIPILFVFCFYFYDNFNEFYFLLRAI